MNFLIDVPAAPVLAENWLRGQFNMHCSAGMVGAFYTLSPTEPPRVQMKPASAPGPH